MFGPQRSALSTEHYPRNPTTFLSGRLIFNFEGTIQGSTSSDRRGQLLDEKQLERCANDVLISLHVLDHTLFDTVIYYITRV